MHIKRKNERKENETKKYREFSRVFSCIQMCLFSAMKRELVSEVFVMKCRVIRRVSTLQTLPNIALNSKVLHSLWVEKRFATSLILGDYKNIYNKDFYSPANGVSPGAWYSSTQSVELDRDAELSEPLDSDAGDLFKSNLPEHLLYSYCVWCHYITTEMHSIYIINAFYEPWCRRTNFEYKRNPVDGMEMKRKREKRQEKKREIKYHCNCKIKIYVALMFLIHSFTGSIEKHEKATFMLSWSTTAMRDMRNGILINTCVVLSKAVFYSD